MSMKKVFGILLAGGTGTRMGAGVNKILLPVDGIPCIVRSGAALAPFVDHLVLVCRPNEEKEIQQLFEHTVLPCRISYASGGSTRQESVFHGLQMLEELFPEDHEAPVLIHDGARCLVEASVIQDVLDSILLKGSGIAAVPVTDTLRIAEEGLRCGTTIPREGVYAMQTPQGARLRMLLHAFRKAANDGFTGTDDAAVLAYGEEPVYLTSGSRFNLKLTTREDLKMAEAVLEMKRSLSFPEVRVGQGYDVHQLTEGRKLILCGVEIPHTHGLLGHSDADVALHALMDALLGAAGLGDIGRHFPDTDDQYEGADSMKLLERVITMLQEHGFRPANADVTIVAQKPKLAPFIPRMAENLASALDLPVSRINVKATTTERLGFEGRMEGISAQAVCLIQEFSPASVS